MNYPISNQLKTRFQRQYSPAAYISRYATVFIIFQILQILISCGLAVCSFKFWEALGLNKVGNELGTMIFAWTATILISLLIYILLNAVLRAFFAGDRIHWLLPVLVCSLMGFDIYANYHGIPELTADMIPPPTDNKTPETDAIFGQQLMALDKEIAGIKHKYYWCPLHKKNHSRHGECASERYWIPGKSKDARRLDQLSKQKTDMISSHTKQRQQNLNEFEQKTGQHNQTLTKRTGQLRYLQFFGYLFLSLVCYWCHHFGAASITDQDPQDDGDPHRDGPDPGDGYRSEKDDHDGILIEKIEVGPDGDFRQQDPGRLRDLTLHDTGHVRADTGPVRHEIHLHGHGFPYSCTNCGKDYMAKRRIPENHRPFCSDPCRAEFWRQQRKKQKNPGADAPGSAAGEKAA